MRTRVILNCVIKIEGIYERSHVKVKVGRGSTSTFKGGFLLLRNFRVRTHVHFKRVNNVRLRVAFHTKPLFYLRAYARESNAAVEIHPNTWAKLEVVETKRLRKSPKSGINSYS